MPAQAEAALREDSEGVTVTVNLPGQPQQEYRYTSAPRGFGVSGSETEEEYYSRVHDILLTGEGHSSWGEFRLIGRVRRSDGLVSISKEYVSVTPRYSDMLIYDAPKGGRRPRSLALSWVLAWRRKVSGRREGR